MIPGTRIGPYEIIAWLGAGGMGEVYRARDARLGREVAIKLIAATIAGNASRVHRFEQEARAAGQLNHPNILIVYDTGIHDGAPYLVSELLEGESLRSRLKNGAVPLLRAIDYAGQTAEGLAAAHDKGIVHRDVKPDNLFISRDGRIKILDFGIAKLATPDDDAMRDTGMPTETAEGMIVGTIGYMSPEQVRGEAVDARSDIFSAGTVLYEMLTGRPPFTRGTAADSMAAILKEDPPQLPADVPAALARIVARCLEKTREARFQSARDLAFALDAHSGKHATVAPATAGPPARRRRGVAVAVVALGLITAVVSWRTWSRSWTSADDPLANAQFTPLTNWDGTEEGAEISPDGKFVAFLSDRGGEFDIWLHQVGTDHFPNITLGVPPLAAGGSVIRKLGFSGDGSEIWFNAGDGKPLMRMPLMGGAPPQPFLPEGANTPAWSPDGGRCVYVQKLNRDDPVYLGDRNCAEARQILAPGTLKNNNPVWSPDGEWIYFARGVEPQDEVDVDIWRVRPSGGLPERLTEQHAAVKFMAPLDARTLLYVARAEDGSGPWLWTLDVERKTVRRVPGVNQFTSVSASLGGHRIVATVANPSSNLWRVPLRDRLADDKDAERYALPAAVSRALAPRFGPGGLFFLSARGTGDGIWKVQDGVASEVWRDPNGALFEPPAVSPDGTRVAAVSRHDGKRHLVIVSADGTNARTLAPEIEIEGAAGQSAADWSPDGRRIVTGGRDAHGPALFIIPVDGGGAIVRLRDGKWVNPLWSPRDDLIVYAGRSIIGQVALQGVRPDGARVDLPELMVRPGGYRFLPGGMGLVYLPRIQAQDFWLFDLGTKISRQLTRLGNQGALRTFDVTRDGKHIVFDRSRQNSNIVLIERPR